MATRSELLVLEYSDLRAEIHQRVANQLLILGGNIVLVAAVVPAYDRLTALAPLSFLIIPLLFGVVAWLYFEQDIFLTQAATYIHRHLRPKLIETLPASPHAREAGDLVPVLGWEHFRGEILFGQRRERRLLTAMTFFRYLATMGPGTAALIIGIYFVFVQGDGLWEYILACLLIIADVAMAIYLATLARLVLRLYAEISQ